MATMPESVEESAAAAAGRRSDHESARDAFVAQAQGWIRRVADEVPEEVLAAALSEEGGGEELLRLLTDAKDRDPISRALMVRTMRAVDRMLRRAPGDLLVSAVAAPSDFAALARTLSDPRVADTSEDSDPLAGALGRSIAHRRLLRERAGEMLSVGQVGQLLGISRQAIDKRRAARRILALRQGSDWLYPAFQFRDGEVLDGLGEVLEACAAMDGWSIVDILLAPDDAFGGRSLLDMLRAGDHAQVARHLDQLGGDGYA